jgi:membrane-associated phospholipid phosphatase
MLLWAGVILILLGAACLTIDRQVAHAFYDHKYPRLERFMEATTHWAKAAHWLVAALGALGLSRLGLLARGQDEILLQMSDYSLAFIACLTLGSVVLHSMKLLVGRRRPRDDMEMGKYGFVWFQFRLDYNSFPSGHALTITCVAVIATCVWPYLAPLWFAIALWLGITRALLTAHFLSDVFIGSGIGLLAARFVLLYVFPNLSPPWF